MNEKQTNGDPQLEAAAAAVAAGGTPAAGAPPSITAPANCIRPYRHGVDSLYLTFKGSLLPSLAVELQEKKLLAQSDSESIAAQAGYKIGDHRFVVRPRGRGRFAFVLEDNWFSIQLSNASPDNLPLALVQLRSEYLTGVGPKEAVATITQLIDGIGLNIKSAKINRIDLFADFSTEHDLTAWPGSHWVKRSKKRAIHEDCDQVTGISFGSGNEVSARLYDKTRELQKSGKDYMRPLWAAQGWDKVSQVWRMEFQIRREGLPEAMLGPAVDALAFNGRLWRYLCEEWLRLAIPSETDDTRSRWPTHPLWHDLVQVWDVDPAAPPLTRVPRTRAPSDHYIFTGGASGITSFMAREGISDLAHGVGEFLQALKAYHNSPERQFPEGLRGYIRRKTKTKALRYNVRMDDDEQ